MTKLLERLEYGLAGAMITLSALYLAGHTFVDNAGFVVIGLFGAVKLLQLYSSRAVDVPNSEVGK